MEEAKEENKGFWLRDGVSKGMTEQDDGLTLNMLNWEVLWGVNIKRKNRALDIYVGCISTYSDMGVGDILGAMCF